MVTYYNILEQEVEKNIKLLLLTIKNIKKLYSAYSNYFLNNNEFIELIETIYNRKMERILDIAKYLTKKYKDEKKEEIDELKLHKILYFSQKEYIMLINDFLFEEDFEGWYLGPINKLVRKDYKFIKMGKEDISLKDIEKKIIDRVFDRYKDMDSYKLSDLSHKEYSWIKSRIGLKRGEKGNQKLLKEDIKIDAERYKKQLIADKKEELLEI